MIELSTLKTNEKNPRKISPAGLKLLQNSIEEFTKMMSLSPIVIDETNTVLGGNMRIAALGALGYTEIPDEWVKRALDLTPEEKRQFIIKHNAHFGSFDFDLLKALDFDLDQLNAWGVDVPNYNANDPLAEWENMPEFTNPANAFHTIHVHFKTESDLEGFAKAIERPLSQEIKTLWFRND